MTPFVFWQTIMAHVLTWGNGFAEIERDRAMRPIGLWTITPDKMAPQGARTGNGPRLRYVYQGKAEIDPEDVLHIPGLGFDGLRGYSVVHMARNSLGLALAAEQFGSSFFGNGAWPGIALQHPGRLGPEASANLVASIENRTKRDRALSAIVLEEGMKVEKIGIPPEDAQFLETREFHVVEVARWLNLPPRKLKLHGGEAPTTPEAGQIEFLTDTLRPWLIRIEQECDRKLIAPAQRSTYYTEHLVNDILKMDGAARADSYKAYFDMGVLDAEQIARMENLPKPKPKPKEEPAPPPPPAEDQERVVSAQRSLVIGLVSRFVRREAAKGRRAAKHGPQGLARWVGEFYESEGEMFGQDLLPVVEFHMARTGAPGDARELSRKIAADYVERSKEELLDLRSAQLEDQVVKLTERWETKRPLEVAETIAAIGREG